MEHDIVVHAWIDIACPWSWIGKHRLEKGIELSGKRVAVEFHSFQLAPDAPTAPHGSAVENLSQAQGASAAEATETLHQITELAAGEGLEINFDLVQEVNAFLAHQLVYAAKATGDTPLAAAIAGAEMFEALFRAHFTAGRNIADPATLVEIAEEFGLDADITADVLESGEYADEVRGDIRDAATLEITGVPFFVVGGRFGLSGAQPPEVFAQTINRALAEMKEAQAAPGIIRREI
ncbi:MAG: DsbA family oxidoreductase [Trueperella sp.]|nr:DsbA family oxidoreductase [Trueperella sp.]